MVAPPKRGEPGERERRASMAASNDKPLVAESTPPTPMTELGGQSVLGV